jgi:hypothetical protein
MRLEELIDTLVSAEKRELRCRIDAGACGTRQDYWNLDKAEDARNEARSTLDEHLAKLTGLRAHINYVIAHDRDVQRLAGNPHGEAAQVAVQARTKVWADLNAVLEVLE